VAQDVVALEDVPPFERSSVDGFAVISSDVIGASTQTPVRLTISGEILMGKPASGALRPGHAMHIPTGGALPTGADGVIKVEDTRESEGHVEVLDGRGVRDHVTARGADVHRGDALRKAGDVLTAAALGMLAGAGHAGVSVYKKPVVGLLVSGDELVEPGRPLRDGEIRDTNSISLLAALRAMGCAPHLYPRVVDRREALTRAFAQALHDSDAVVVSGGSSVGERDYTPAVVAAAGTPGVIVHGVRAKPGRPTLLGVIGDKPVIGLPGNPVSALVMLETLGKPILLRLLGKRDETVPVRARLAHTIDVHPGLEHRIPVQFVKDGDDFTAVPLLGTSAQMRVLGFADALVIVPEGMGIMEAGSWVDALPLTRSGGLR
jgi:molybdopterin molybdotransferase